MQDEDSFIGSYFGNYQVISEIAYGAFGCVYKAQHLYLPRMAAVKLLHEARLQSALERKRFLREAQFLEVLKHRHILPIYEFGISSQLDQLPYLVTEYAPNGSLRDLLNAHPQRRLPVSEAISILSQVGKALQYAHQHEIIHQDLKPQNILFNVKGEVLLADFGIAISIAKTPQTVDSQSLISGTPTYMAPEQFRGEATRRSDQYALACIAYEMMTGRPPFTARTAAMLGLKHIHEAPTAPSLLNPQIPFQVERAILKALEKRRINRFSNVPTFIRALYGISFA